MRHFYSGLCVLVLVVSCVEKEVTYQELIDYVQEKDNGLHLQQEANGILAEVTYKPTDLWVYLETDDESVSLTQLDSLRKHYTKYHYFTLSLSKDNKEALHSAVGSMDQYSELVQTLSFRMRDYVTLTTSQQDTIPVGDFILDRTYGLSSATSLLFVFAKEKTEKVEWIQFNLNEFGLGTGNQRFRFRSKDITNTPTIRFATPH